MKSLVKSYRLISDTRLGQPFTAREAKESKRKKPVHLVGGDFNVYPGLSEYGIEEAGFAKPLIGSKVAYLAGRKNFDNILVDAEATGLLFRFVRRVGVTVT